MLSFFCVYTSLGRSKKKEFFDLHTYFRERRPMESEKCVSVGINASNGDRLSDSKFTHKAGFDWWEAPPSMDDACPWGNDNFSLETAQSKGSVWNFGKELRKDIMDLFGSCVKEKKKAKERKIYACLEKNYKKKT